MNADARVLGIVRSTLMTRRMVRRGERVVVAVSGGADSVCLLDMLARLSPDLDLRLVAAHFDHGLRPAQDPSETRFVASLARDRGLPFETNETPPDLQTPRGSLEERAREARYDFLEGVRRAHRADRVAVGHTLDDQAETVLMRLLQGAGPTGLSGMPPVRAPGVVRPLIRIRRHEVEAYLEAAGLTWRDDPTNLETHFLRNRIRRELLPALRDLQPRVVEHLGDLADLLREENAFLDGLAGAWVSAWSETPHDSGVVLPRPGLARLPRALRRRVIRRALADTSGGLRGVGRSHVAAVEDLIAGDRPHARLDLPGGRCVLRSYDRVRIGPPRAGGRTAYRVLVPGPGVHILAEAGWRVRLEERPRHEVSRLSGPRWRAVLDADGLSYPLEMRPWGPGDRIVPLGMKGRKKVKDVLIDAKVPLEERQGLPLLLSRGRPVWLCGIRIDDRFKVTEETERVLVVDLEPLG